ncbi:MAG: isopentenyl-diphosphate Delta-isomerase [Salibacteraceae bacterium]
MAELSVILVDENDNPLGTMEKMLAHEKGVLHRAFSVFLFNSNNEILLQKRALNKYHAPGLWTNSCCSHQAVGESNVEAAKRRVFEELGIHVESKEAFTFTYRADMGNGLTEHEFDHVLIGAFEGECFPNSDEVMDYSYVSIENIELDMNQKPEKYTPWFRIVFPKLIAYLQTQKVSK